jgi:hypothetical protein
MHGYERAMRSTRKTTRRPHRVTISAAEIERFLGSDAGRILRGAVAAGLVIGVPLLMRAPVMRRHPLLRGLELLGGMALVIKLAEAMRDWEPRTPIRLDVE